MEEVRVRGLWLHQKGFWYYTRMRNGIKFTVALHTQDRDTAVQMAMKLLNIEPQQISGDTLEDEIDRFVADKEAKGKFTRFSAPEKKRTLLRFAKWHGAKKLPTSVTLGVMENYLEHLRSDGKMPSTVLGYMMTVRSLFSWLVEKRKIPTNPCEDVEYGERVYGAKDSHVEEGDAPLYCDAELRDKLLAGWRTIPSRILDKNKAKTLGFVLHAGFEAGLRKNEIIEARPNWFFTEKKKSMRVARTSTFLSKGKRARTIPMTDVLADFMKEYLDGHEGIWCIAATKERGVSKYRFDFNKTFIRYMQYMGEQLKTDLTWVTPHVMRHTFGSLLAIANTTTYKIAKWMGDSEKVVIAHYAHLQADDSSINKLRAPAAGGKTGTPKRTASAKKKESRGPAKRRSAASARK